MKNDHGIEADMSLTSAWPQHFGYGGYYNHFNHPYYSHGGHWGGNIHKYGYVPHGVWGNQPHPLTAKERESWDVHHKNMSENGGRPQEVIIKDHESKTEYVVEHRDPKHQVRDRMKEYDAHLKTQILIDNRYGTSGSKQMNIHHQPMLTRYHPHANHYRAGYHPGAPYIPPHTAESS